MNSVNLFFVNSLTLVLRKYNSSITITARKNNSFYSYYDYQLIKINKAGKLIRYVLRYPTRNHLGFRRNDKRQIREIKPILESKQPTNKPFFKATIKSKKSTGQKVEGNDNDLARI